MSLANLNPLANVGPALESELGALYRVTFERDWKGRILNQSGYNRADRLLYTLHYPQPDIAEYKEGAFSKAVRESGITHIRFVRPDTGPEARLDKELFYLDSSGKLQPDHDGTYGYRHTFSALGLPVEATNLGGDRQPAPNRTGVAKTTFIYDGEGNITRALSLGSNGQPVLSSTGVAEARLSYDQYGNVKELALFGTGGQLVTCKQCGFARQTLAYDGYGNIVENTFFGPDRRLTVGHLGFARQTVVWDEKGRAFETYFGADGKPVPIFGRVIKQRGAWDERGNLVEMAFFDENDRPVRNDTGCAKISMTYDQHGNLTESACFDEGDQAVRDTDGRRGSGLPMTNAESGRNDLFWTMVSQDVMRMITRKPVEIQSARQIDRRSYFDAADRPAKNKDGYAKITRRYDCRARSVRILLR
jgi:hypothetical protein